MPSSGSLYGFVSGNLLSTSYEKTSIINRLGVVSRFNTMGFHTSMDANNVLVFNNIYFQVKSIAHANRYNLDYCTLAPVTILSITAQATSHTNVRIIFSQPVINDHPLTDPLNYVFSPSLNVVSVSPDTSSQYPNFVDLTVSNMNSVAYTVTIQNITSVS